MPHRNQPNDVRRCVQLITVEEFQDNGTGKEKTSKEAKSAKVCSRNYRPNQSNPTPYVIPGEIMPNYYCFDAKHLVIHTKAQKFLFEFLSSLLSISRNTKR
jgi:hypothetical protein